MGRFRRINFSNEVDKAVLSKQVCRLGLMHYIVVRSDKLNV
jgi:hypothetical protein